MESNTTRIQSGHAVRPYWPPALSGAALPPTVSGTGATSVASGTNTGSFAGDRLVATAANVTGFGGFWGAVIPTSSLGFVIHTSLSALRQPNTDFYSRASLLNFPFPFPTLSLAPEPVRYLTIDEQGIFHRALRRSVRLIHKAKRVA